MLWKAYVAPAVLK